MYRCFVLRHLTVGMQLIPFTWYLLSPSQHYIEKLRRSLLIRPISLIEPVVDATHRSYTLFCGLRALIFAKGRGGACLLVRFPTADEPPPRNLVLVRKIPGPDGGAHEYIPGLWYCTYMVSYTRYLVVYMSIFAPGVFFLLLMFNFRSTTCAVLSL